MRSGVSVLMLAAILLGSGSAGANAPLAGGGWAERAGVPTRPTWIGPGIEWTPEVRAVVRAIRDGARAVPGMDPAFLMAVASRESTFDGDARNGQARGLFQFQDRTWLVAVGRYGGRHGRPDLESAVDLSGGGAAVRDPRARAAILALRDDPDFAARMAAELLLSDASELVPTLGRAPRPAEIYATHLMGLEGARGFLRGVARGEGRAAYAALHRDLETRRARYAAVLATFEPFGEAVAAETADRSAASPFLVAATASPPASVVRTRPAAPRPWRVPPCLRPWAGC